MAFVHATNLGGWFEVPSRERQQARTSTTVRRSSLILPVNVPRFVERAYARGADARPQPGRPSRRARSVRTG